MLAGFLAGVAVGLLLGILAQGLRQGPATVVFERDAEGRIVGIHYVPGASR